MAPPAGRFPCPQNPLPSAPKRFRISCPSGRGPLGRRNKAQCVCLSVCLSVRRARKIKSSLCDVCVSGRCHPRCTTMSTADPILSPPSRPSCLPRDAAMHGDVMAWVSVCQVSVWPHVCVCRPSPAIASPQHNARRSLQSESVRQKNLGPDHPLYSNWRQQAKPLDERLVPPITRKTRRECYCLSQAGFCSPGSPCPHAPARHFPVGPSATPTNGAPPHNFSCFLQRPASVVASPRSLTL